MNRLLCLFLLLCLNLPLFSQIEGIVVDHSTQQPLPDTYIVTDLGTYVTDSSGKFFIQQPTQTLIATHLGYLPDTLIITGFNMIVLLH